MLGSYLELVKTSMTAGRGVTVRQVDVERARLGGRRPRSAPQTMLSFPWLPPPRPGGLVGVRAHGRDAGWRAWICPGFQMRRRVTTARHGWRRRSRPPPRPGGHGREAAWRVRRRRVHGCTHTRPGEHGQPRRSGSGAAFVWRCGAGRGMWVGFGLGLRGGLDLVSFHFWQGTVDLHRTLVTRASARVRTEYAGQFLG
jgi:hypothetical protein